MKNLKDYLNEAKQNDFVKFNGKKVLISSLEIDGVDTRDHPDYVDTYFSYAEYSNGKELTDDELQDFTDEFSEIAQEMANDQRF